jgi:DNA (cytosine-5)-methyltransferase 1
LDGITFSKWRNESIRAYGNAVVPNVVFEIFKAIEKFDQTNEPT